jgi:hypothetical protein
MAIIILISKNNDSRPVRPDRLDQSEMAFGLLFYKNNIKVFIIFKI